MDQAQFTHLQALEDSVNEAAWGAHLAAYAPGSDATDGSGGGIIEPGFGTTTSPEAAARTRRREVALNRLIQKVKREAREREENLEKRAAVAATYVQRDTVAGSQTVGGRADGDESVDTSSEITPAIQGNPPFSRSVLQRSYTRAVFQRFFVRNLQRWGASVNNFILIFSRIC